MFWLSLKPGLCKASFCILLHRLYPFIPFVSFCFLSEIHVFSLGACTVKPVATVRSVFAWSCVMHGCKASPIEPFIYSLDSCKIIFSCLNGRLVGSAWGFEGILGKSLCLAKFWLKPET